MTPGHDILISGHVILISGHVILSEAKNPDSVGISTKVR